MVIAKANGCQVLTGDIKNAYLYADCGINISAWVGFEFKSAGCKESKAGSKAKVEKALYDFPSSGHNQHSHLAGTGWTLGFKPTRYDKDMLIHQNEAGSSYNFNGCYTDDLLIVVANTQKMLSYLMIPFTTWMKS